MGRGQVCVVSVLGALGQPSLRPCTLRAVQPLTSRGRPALWPSTTRSPSLSSWRVVLPLLVTFLRSPPGMIFCRSTLRPSSRPHNFFRWNSHLPHAAPPRQLTPQAVPPDALSGYSLLFQPHLTKGTAGRHPQHSSSF